MAHYDALTDLPNRVLFREQLEGALTADSIGEQLAVLYIDIDEFKSVNDALGHSIGDELLKTVARRLRGCLSAADVVGPSGWRRICGHSDRGQEPVRDDASGGANLSGDPGAL